MSSNTIEMYKAEWVPKWRAARCPHTHTPLGLGAHMCKECLSTRFEDEWFPCMVCYQFKDVREGLRMGGGGGGEGRKSVSNHSEIGVHTHTAP